MAKREEILQYFVRGLERERNMLLWFEKESNAKIVCMFGREKEFNEGVMFLRGFDDFIKEFSIPRDIVRTRRNGDIEYREFILSGIRFFTEQEVAV